MLSSTARLYKQQMRRMSSSWNMIGGHLWPKRLLETPRLIANEWGKQCWQVRTLSPSCFGYKGECCCCCCRPQVVKDAGCRNAQKEHAKELIKMIGSKFPQQFTAYLRYQHLFIPANFHDFPQSILCHYLHNAF